MSLQEALHSLQTDAGLQALLPRFSLAIAEGVGFLIQFLENLDSLKIAEEVCFFFYAIR